MEILKILEQMREFEQNHKIEDNPKDPEKVKSGLTDKQKYLRSLRRW